MISSPTRSMNQIGHRRYLYLPRQLFLLIIFFAIWSFSFLTSVTAQENLPAKSSSPDTLIVEGRYVMGDKDSKADARQYALLDAKRKALEQIGIYIKSGTTVKNFMLTDQEIQSYSAGFLKTEILEEREEPMGETRVVIVKVRVIADPQAIRREIQKMVGNETYRQELSQLQREYQKLWKSMDSLRARGQFSERMQLPPRSPKREVSFSRWKELSRYDLLIQLIVESNREHPDLSRAENLTSTIIQKFPNMNFVYGYLGISYFKNGRIDPAIKYLQKALSGKPGWRIRRFKSHVPQQIRERYQREQALFHYYLSRAFLKKHQLRQARRHLQMARSLDPKNPRYRLGLHRIEK